MHKNKAHYSMKKRNMIPIVITIMLLLFTAFLIRINYLSQTQLQEAALKRWQMNTEKMASTVSYFLRERRRDIRNLSNNRAILVFFENKALGMSMEYGLMASLNEIKLQLDHFVKECKFDKREVYHRVVLIDADGKLLADSTGSGFRPDPNLNWKGFLTPNRSNAEILAECDTQHLKLIISKPYFFKGHFSGQLLAWINPETLYDQLFRIPKSVSNLIGLISNKGQFHLMGSAGIRISISKLAYFAKMEPWRIQSLKITLKNGSQESLTALRVPIKSTPLSLVNAIPTSEIVGEQGSPILLLISMGVLAILLLGGLVALWQVNTRNLILNVRLEEAAKSKREIEENNRLLEMEIEKRRRTEKALQEKEQKYRELYEESTKAEKVYRSLLHSSADAIAIYNLEGKVNYISPAFTRIFGWTIDELNGKEIPFVPESEKEAYQALIHEVIEKGTPCHGFETKRYTKDGRLLDISISASRYDDHEGRAAGMLMVLRDISQRKQLETQLYHAQKMKALGTLAGGVAHDFNNLLMAIQGNISLMLLNMDPNNQDYEKLKSVEEYVRDGANLTKQLLGFASTGKYDVKVANINELIKKSAMMFAATRKEINLHEKYSEALWYAEVDRGQIEQVLINIFVNAAQAMPEGGDLHIQTENVNLGEGHDQIAGLEPGKYIKVSIRDTGAGMDKETQQRVFEPFFTTKETGKGYGLGLASAYGIIKSHGGTITVESEKNRGSTFTVYLPASEKQKFDKKAETSTLPKGEETILIVDDEERILNVEKQILETLGYKVLTAKSGREAIQMYKEHSDRVDLVILDMIMPEMGGNQVYKKFREINPDVSVILSSGYSDLEHATEILKEKGGRKSFIQKPFSIKDLAKRVREILDEDPATPNSER